MKRTSYENLTLETLKLGTSLDDMYIVMALLSYFQHADPMLRTNSNPSMHYHWLYLFQGGITSHKTARVCDVRLDSIRI